MFPSQRWETKQNWCERSNPFSSVAQSCPTHDNLDCSTPAFPVHHLTCSNSCSLSYWCHPIISSSAILFFSCLQSFPASRSFQMSQFFASVQFSSVTQSCLTLESGGQSIGVSASAPLLPMNIQDWFPLVLIGWISLLSKELLSFLQHHSSKSRILQQSAFFIVQLSHPYMTSGKTIAFTRWTFINKVISLLFNMLSRLVITFLPRSKNLLISWLQSSSAVILELPQNKSLSLFPLFPHLFAMKWWDWMPWS